MSQVIFNLDPKIKAKAMKRAKREGIPLSVYFKVVSKAYAEGRLTIAIDEIKSK